MKLFAEHGAINNVMNDFAEFMWNRKTESIATQKEFVKKLESLSGCSNSAASLLQQRIDRQEINYKYLSLGRSLVNEMKESIKKYS